MILDFSIFLQKSSDFFRFQPVFGSVISWCQLIFFKWLSFYPCVRFYSIWSLVNFWKLLSTCWLQWFFVCAKLPRERVPKIPQFFLKDNMLNINFDVTMLDMSCDHVTVGVWDASLGGFLANKNRTTEGWILRIDRHTHTWLLTTDFLAKTRVVAN